jgi:L-galactonate dehydratase
MGSVPEPTLDNVEIIGFEVTDLRFPTSLDGVGSDAMHVGTNGSHPYVRLLTNHAGLVGEGIVSLLLLLLLLLSLLSYCPPPWS